MASSSPKSGELARFEIGNKWAFANHYAVLLYYTYSKCYDTFRLLYAAADTHDQVKTTTRYIVSKLKLTFLASESARFKIQSLRSLGDAKSPHDYFHVRRTAEC